MSCFVLLYVVYYFNESFSRLVRSVRAQALDVWTDIIYFIIIFFSSFFLLFHAMPLDSVSTKL